MTDNAVADVASPVKAYGDIVCSGDGATYLVVSERCATAPFKYGEARIAAEVLNYLASTYSQHYVGRDNVQSIDLINSSGHLVGFCVGDIIKYASRLGKKKGQARKDLLKIIHYAVFLLSMASLDEIKGVSE